VTGMQRRRIQSPRFGAIEVDDASRITFDGLPGFPDLRHFVVLHHDRDSAFGWLQSFERPEVAFPVIDPRPWFPSYRPALRVAVLHALEAAPTDPLEWLAIATARDGAVTLNLAAPLLVNPANRRGVQAVLEDETWSTSEPLVPPGPREGPDPATSQIESKPRTKSGQGRIRDSERR